MEILIIKTYKRIEMQQFRHINNSDSVLNNINKSY